MEYILLPCLGNPLREVWLPPKDAGLGALVIPPPTYKKMLTQQATAHARSFDIKKPVVRMLGNSRIQGVAVYVLVLWLKPGEAPAGLCRVPISEALDHQEFGQMVTAFQTQLTEYNA